MSKFKVGDKVRLVVGVYEPEIPRGSVLDVVSDGVLGAYWITPEAVEVGMANAGSHEFQLVEEQAPQTSKEKPSFVSFFTSVIVAKNKAVSDIGEMLYDENTTKIYLEDEGGGAFLIVEQDYNGAIQQIRLDIDEVDTVFSAIKQLVNQMDG
ncbi:hypothetical protein ACPF8X_36920 [Streptomyces sp. G35A]